MKKKITKPVIVTKPMSDLEDFQAQFGADFKKLTEHPAFQAAMQLLNIRKLEKVTNLQDSDIEKNGREILADLRGHLQHENDLVSLPEKKEFKLPFDEPDVYLSPEQVAEAEQLMDKFREQTKRQRYA